MLRNRKGGLNFFLNLLVSVQSFGVEKMGRKTFRFPARIHHCDQPQLLGARQVLSLFRLGRGLASSFSCFFARAFIAITSFRLEFFLIQLQNSFLEVLRGEAHTSSDGRNHTFVRSLQSWLLERILV